MKKYICFKLIILLYSFITIKVSYACTEYDPVITMESPTYTFYVPLGGNPYLPDEFIATASDEDDSELTWQWDIWQHSSYTPGILTRQEARHQRW